ncbi:MAG: helix-turn-helix domain-containing protein [Rhizomicrobium sp.]
MTNTRPTVEDPGEPGRRHHLREISGDAAIQTVGQDFRAARLRRGDDISVVSRVLRIRKDHIEAIEENRLENLPGRTYAVGFVRSYAEYLKLDAAEYVERFKSGIAGQNDGSPQVGAPPDPGGNRLPLGWTAMAVLVVAVLVYGSYYLARSADVVSTQPVAAVPARIAPVAPQHKIRRGAPPGTKTGSGAVPVAVAANLSPAAFGSAPGPGTPGATSLGNGQLAALPPGQVLGTQNKNVRVILHARAVTRILVQGPGGRVYINRILHPGDAYRVPDLVGLSLTTPDGGDVSLELDGQDMGLAGRIGQMTEALSLDPQAIVDRTGRANPR